MDTAKFQLDTPEKTTIILFVVVFSWLCYWYQITNPVCCDALDYLELGNKIITKGFTAAVNERRLYGYPLFVAFNIKLVHLIPLHTTFILYLVQIGLYLLGVYLVSHQIALVFSSVIANICFFSLLANVFIYPYLAVSLTDGFSVTLLLFICYVILKLFSEPFPLFLNQKSALLSIVLGFLTGFAIMVRPANISWILLLFPVIIMSTFHCRDSWYWSGQTLAICIGFTLAVAPQLQLNWDAFGRFTFLPIYDFSGNQIQWGISYIKCAGLMVDHPKGFLWIYANTAAHGSSESIAWYLNNPIAGIKTIFLHIFAAFDFNYLFPYIYNSAPKYQILLFLFSHIVLFWSVAGYMLAIYSVNSNSVIDSKAISIQKLLLALYACLVFGWLAVHALSAIENRFSLPIVAAMLPLAAWVLFIKVKYLNVRSWLYGLFLVYLLLAWQLSTYISSLRTV